GNGVTRKAAKNVVASSSYRTPSKSVLPVQRTKHQWPFTGVLPERQGHHGYARGLHSTEFASYYLDSLFSPIAAAFAVQIRAK
ncbi:hypothetical protein, partial [Mitsuokella jalaludinii]|uniref:hypothetical protein n=1 Tax=Mitsuokella jalaludinii TaxID=187979 RepID=UPI001B8050B7